MHLNSVIWNKALEISLDFGEQMNDAIHERMASFHPELTLHELDTLNEKVYEIRDKGLDFIRKFISKKLHEQGGISKMDLMLKHQKFMLGIASWIHMGNVTSIFNKAMKDAEKEGLLHKLGV